MSWFDKRATRPVVEWPEGRDWRCQGTPEAPGCGYSKPEDAGGYGCPDCGGPLSRTVIQQ